MKAALGKPALARAGLAPRAFVVGAIALCALALGARAGFARELPSVASINLCTDQLVLRLADEAQILTLSWLAFDPEESVLAVEAARFVPNYGSAEEVLRFDPDVVIAGAFTNSFTRALLRDLGYRVVDIAPAQSVEDIERNLQAVAEAIGQRERGEAAVAALRERVARYRRLALAGAVDAVDAVGAIGAIGAIGAVGAVGAVVVRPGGFTVEAGSLADELIRLAGLRNLAAERGLDRWGSLALETLLRSDPELLILTGYRRDAPSLANHVLEHPSLESLRGRVATVTLSAAHWGCGLPESLDTVDTMRRAAAGARRTTHTPRRETEQ